MAQVSENKAILDISKAIYASLSFLDQKVQAQMNLPSLDQTDNELLALALQHLLLQRFRVTFPASDMRKVSNGESVKFNYNKLPDKLPSRAISICIDSDHPHITISGIPAKNGRDGFSELHFKWQKQAGAQDRFGNTDLKKLNTFPTVQKGDLLATIVERTLGTPGVNALGKLVKPQVGNLLLLKFDANSIEQRRDENDSTKFYLYAKKSGIADFTTLQPDNPKTLNQIAIHNTITINGDIDYNVGDLSDNHLGCGAINIVVTGDVRGAFSLQSKGYISVSGTVEGQKIAAKNIKANVIIAGSEAIASNILKIGTLIKAKARGRVITIKRASNDSELIGDEQVNLKKGANCRALTIRTRILNSESNNFSGRTLVVLGQELFDQERQIVKQYQADTKALAEDFREITQLGQSAIFNLRQFKIFITEGLGSVTPECRELLTAIQEELHNIVKAMNRPLHPKLFNQCYSLPNLLGDTQETEAIISKSEALINSLQILNKALHSRCAIISRTQISTTLLQELRQEVEELCAHFENLKFITDASDIIIQCGTQHTIIDRGNMPPSPFHVTYALTSETGISAGVLVCKAAF